MIQVTHLSQRRLLCVKLIDGLVRNIRSDSFFKKLRKLNNGRTASHYARGERQKEVTRPTPSFRDLTT